MSEAISENGSPTDGDIPETRSRGRRLAKPILSVILIIFVLGVGGTAFQALALLKQDPVEREAVVKVYNVEVFPIRSTDIPEYFPAYGTAEAHRDVVIAAKVAGEIQTSPDTYPQLKAGKHVDPGNKLLLLIDPSSYLQLVKQAELQVTLDEEERQVLRKEMTNNQKLLDQAKENVAEYRREFLRIENAKKLGAAVESELSKSKLELQRYEILLTRAQNTQDLYPTREKQIIAKKEQHLAEQKLAEIDLKHTRVSVPFKGMLSEVLVEAGEYVRAGDPLVRLTDATIVDIPMALSLEDFGKIDRMVREARNDDERPRVSLSVSKNAPMRWTGHVVRVSPHADEVTRTVKVYVRVINNNESSQGEPGPTVVIPRMHYFGKIQGPILKQVLVVPRDAITGQRDADSRRRVFVAGKLKESTVTDAKTGKTVKVYDGFVEERKIKVRRTFRDLAIIELGLKDGEFVVLTNLDVIHDGARVRFREEQIHKIQDELRD